MRVLVIAPRTPQSDGKGDAVRAAAIVAALARNHEVDVFVPAASAGRRVLSALADGLAGRPAQVGFSMPRGAWAAARAAAAHADVVVSITVRAIRGPLPVPVIIDHVDALSLNWTLRANGPEGRLRRLVVRLEARSLLRWERRVATWAVAQLVLSEHDVAALPPSPRVEVIGQAVTLETFPEVPRDIDVVFTGNMRYPPNREAALWLDREIVPAIRAIAGGARVVIAGRDADGLPVKNTETMADVPSILAVLARSRVAIVPLIGIGTGAPNKALEAAAGGAALVVTPWMNKRLPLPARVASDAAGLAAEVASLLADEAARRTLADEARTALRLYGIDRIAAELDRAVESARAGAKPRPAGAPVGLPRRGR